MSKPAGQRYTVAVDFDGVLHSYQTPWKNARTIPDPPVPGAINWLLATRSRFEVAIISTRNRTWLGRRAMRHWIHEHVFDHFWKMTNEMSTAWTVQDVMEEADQAAWDFVNSLQFPKHKPAALVYIDDRAWRFTGDNFPTADEIHAARPWNKPKP